MQDNVLQFVNQTQEVNRSIYDAIEAGARTHFKTIQRLTDIQRDVFNQAIDAAGEELQLITEVRDPRDFASAQADLVKGYGQKYVDCVNEAIGILSEAWDEYGQQLQESVNGARERARRAAQAAAKGVKEASESASETSKRAASTKKS
jgi:gas vesicle protein